MTSIVYTVYFKDYSGNDCQVDIRQTGFTGTTTEIESGPEPCVISMLGEGDDKFTHIKATECKLQLLNTTSLQYLSLFLSPVKTYYVNVFRDSNFLWQGWINPEYYTEPFSPVPYITNVSVNDGLAELKNISFPLPSYTVYKHSIMSYISTCLDQIGFPVDLGIKISLGLSATTLADGVITSRLFEKMFIDYRAFRDEDIFWNCYDILDSILSSFNARLFQWDGYWHIERLDQKHAAYDVEVYNRAGVFQSTVSYDAVTTLTAHVGAGTDIRFQMGANLEVQPAYKGFNITQDYGNRTNILPFGNFDGNFYSDEFNGDDLRRWTLVDGITLTEESEFHAVRFKGLNTGAPFANGYIISGNAVIQSEGGTPLTQFMTAWGNSDLILKFRFSVAFKKENLTDSINIASYIRLYANFSGNLYTIDEGFSGESSDGSFTYYDPGSPSLSDIIIYPPSGEWKDIEITLRKPPDAEMALTQTNLFFYLHIFKGWSSEDAGTDADGIMFSNISLAVEKGYHATLDGSKDVKYDTEYNQVIDIKNIVEPTPYEFNFGDTPFPYGTGGNGLVNKYVIFDSSNFAVQLFGNGGTHTLSLVSQIIAGDLNAAYNVPKFKLKGTIIDSTTAKAINFLTCLKDYDNRYYIMTGGEYNLKDSTFAGEWIQMYDDSGTTGEFNDDFSDDFFT
jgi:hypothetical protein